MSCWEGLCKKKDDLSPLVLITINSTKGKFVFDECRKACHGYKITEELRNPGKTVTGCQYIEGGGCGYYTEPIQDLGVDTAMDMRLVKEQEENGCVEDQCCVFRESRFSITRNNIRKGSISLSGTYKNSTHIII